MDQILSIMHTVLKVSAIVLGIFLAIKVIRTRSEYDPGYLGVKLFLLSLIIIFYILVPTIWRFSGQASAIVTLAVISLIGFLIVLPRRKSEMLKCEICKTEQPIYSGFFSKGSNFLYCRKCGLHYCLNCQSKLSSAAKRYISTTRNRYDAAAVEKLRNTPVSTQLLYEEKLGYFGSGCPNCGAGKDVLNESPQRYDPEGKYK